MWSFDSSYSLGFFVLICGWCKLIKFRKKKKGSSSVNTCFNVSSLGYVFLNFFISVSLSVSLCLVPVSLSLSGHCLSVYLSLCVYMCVLKMESFVWWLRFVEEWLARPTFFCAFFVMRHYLDKNLLVEWENFLQPLIMSAVKTAVLCAAAPSAHACIIFH